MSNKIYIKKSIFSLLIYNDEKTITTSAEN